MRATHVSVRVAPVRGALSYGEVLHSFLDLQTAVLGSQQQSLGEPRLQGVGQHLPAHSRQLQHTPPSIIYICFEITWFPHSLQD